MRLVDASSFIDPSAENFPSPSPTRWLFNASAISTSSLTAKNAAAAVVLTESEMSEEGETTSVVHHLQRDFDNHSVNTESDLLVDMAGGMTMSPTRMNVSDLLVMSPPRMTFSGEEAAFFLSPNFHADMVGGMIMSTSPPRMNCFSPPSVDSIGNFDPYGLWSFPDHSKVQELENRKGMMMRPNWKQQQPCIEEVDAASALGQNESLGILPEAESWEETVRQSCCWGSHPQPQTSDDYSVNNVDEQFQFAGGITEILLIMICSLSGVTPSLLILACLCKNIVILELWNIEHIIILRLNVEQAATAYLKVDFYSEKNYGVCSSQSLELEIWGWMMELISVSQRLWYAFCSNPHRWSVVLRDVVVGLPLYKGTENYSFGNLVNHDPSSSSSSSSSVNTKMHGTFIEILCREEEEVGTASENNHSVSILPVLLEAEWRMMRMYSPSKVSPFTFKRARLDFGITRCSLEEGGPASDENCTADVWPALEAEYNAAGRGGMLLQQEDSSSEPHIPESSATNEERNNVVELNNSINDAKGGSSSSEKTETISRWEKDHGITCQVHEPLFGKSRDDAAETLKVSTSTFKRARRDFGITRHSLEDVGTASEENHTADIWPALEAEYNAAGRRGMLLQQEDSSSETHIPESSATNEERNNVVELNNSIDDAKGGNSSSEKTKVQRWEKDHGITRQVLEQLFGKSRDAAAETLNVSTSTFKRACRDLGINRWPNHNRKRTNSSLNQKQHAQAVKKNKGNQSCPALPPEEATTTLHLPPEEATTTTLQGNSPMSVKVTYEDNTIRFPLPSSSTMKYLEEQLETRFKISLEIFSIMYQDEEDDWISLTCDSDLIYGMHVLRSSGKTVVKMKIKPNFG